MHACGNQWGKNATNLGRFCELQGVCACVRVVMPLLCLSFCGLPKEEVSGRG